MSNKRKRVYQMSKSELSNIGDFYLHNSPENFSATLTSIGLGNLQRIQEESSKAIYTVMQSHVDSLSAMVNKLLTKSKSNINNRQKLLKEMKKTATGERKNLLISSFDNIKIIMTKIPGSNKKTQQEIDKLVKEAEKQIEAFLKQITILMGEMAFASSPTFYEMTPLIYAFSSRTKNNKVSSKVEKELKETELGRSLLKELKNVEEEVERAAENSDYANSKLYKIFNQLRRLSEGKIHKARGGVPLFGLLNEKLVAEFVLKAVAEKAFAADSQPIIKTVGEEFARDAVADISMEFEDINVGFSLKHSTLGRTLAKTYDMPKTYQALFGGFQNEDKNDIGLLVQYIKNNVYFLRDLPKRKGYINALKKIEEEAVKLRVIARAFDGFYQYSKKKDNFEIEYYTVKGDIYDKENVKIISSVFFMLDNELFYTDEIIQSLMDMVHEKRKEKGLKIAKTGPVSLPTPPNSEETNRLKTQKDKWIAKNRGSNINYIDIARGMESTMKKIQGKMNTKGLFYKKARIDISYQALLDEVNKNKK